MTNAPTITRAQIEAHIAEVQNKPNRNGFTNGYTAEEKEIIGQILNAIDGVAPYLDPNSSKYTGDKIYTESEFLNFYYADLIDAPETNDPAKYSYADNLCTTFKGVKKSLISRGFSFPLSRTREDVSYEMSVENIWSQIGRFLRSALGYAGDDVMIGDSMCEATRARSPAKVQTQEQDTFKLLENKIDATIEDIKQNALTLKNLQAALKTITHTLSTISFTLSIKKPNDYNIGRLQDYWNEVDEGWSNFYNIFNELSADQKNNIANNIREVEAKEDNTTDDYNAWLDDYESNSDNQELDALDTNTETNDAFDDNDDYRLDESILELPKLTEALNALTLDDQQYDNLHNYLKYVQSSSDRFHNQ